MDELEISGKRYISSRRAAKENKYHTDYIGQLIRAGRIVGTKVGRAWYVEVNSLEKYLRGDFSLDSEAVLERPVVAVDCATSLPHTTLLEELVTKSDMNIEEEAPYEEVSQSALVAEVDYVQKTNQQNELTIPIKIYLEEEGLQDSRDSKKTLQYVYDDSPLLPEIHTSSNENEYRLDQVSSQGSYAGVATKPTRARRSQRRPQFISILALGALILGVAAACSSLVSERLTVESGKVASVGYIFLK